MKRNPRGDPRMQPKLEEQLKSMKESLTNPNDGRDPILRAVDALFALEPSLKSRGDQVMAIVLLAVGQTIKERESLQQRGIAGPSIDVGS
jgi:hypothetical protein